MKKLILLIPVLIILAGCDASGGRKIPAPSADILNSDSGMMNGNTVKGGTINCDQMPWKTDQKLCGYVNFRKN